jgi:hypothetical protein
MGRNKPSGPKPRSNPVFKVVGGKAGKVKGKTQEVSSRLKQLVRKSDAKDSIEKLDSQMSALQKSGVSFSGKSPAPADKKKVVAVAVKPDVPPEDIENMIDSFTEATAGLRINFL